MREGQSMKELMQLLREKHKITIAGNKHEAALLRMGYFHGFKGYRFLKTPEEVIPYTHFDQVIAVYEFDTRMKALFYPQLMFIETALKNVTLDAIIQENSAKFDDVYRHVLIDYEKHEPGSAKYKRKMKSRLDLRTKVYRTIAYNYTGDNPMVRHFLNDDRSVPLWVIFEIINLGDFGFFVHCMHKEMRINIMEKLGMNVNTQSNTGRVLEDMIFLLRDVRNAVAHNAQVFDCRYRKRKVVPRLIQFLGAETGEEGISFETIVDDFLLITYLMEKLGMGADTVTSFKSEFLRLLEALKQEVPTNIFEMILGDEARQID